MGLVMSCDVGPLVLTYCLWKYYTERSELEVGVLGDDDLRWCVYNSRYRDPAGDICPRHSRQKGLSRSLLLSLTLG